MDKPKIKYCMICNRELTLETARETHKGNGRLRSKCKSCENSKRNSSYEKKAPKPLKSKIHYCPAQKKEESSDVGRFIKSYSTEPLDLDPFEFSHEGSYDVGIRLDTGDIVILDTTKNINRLVEWDFPATLKNSGVIVDEKIKCLGFVDVASKCNGVIVYQKIKGFVDKDGDEILYSEPLNGYRC